MAKCVTSIKGRVLRAVRQDALGNPVVGLTSVATHGFVQLDLTPVLQEGTEFQLQDAWGDFCVNERDASRLRRYDAELTLCGIDPEFVELATGARLITDEEVVPEAIGFAVGVGTEPGPFSLELWTKVAGGDGSVSWIHWAVPQMVNGRLGAFSFVNGPLSVTMTAETKANPNYGAGPFALWTDPIGDDEHLAVQANTLAPPAAACGYQELAA